VTEAHFERVQDGVYLDLSTYELHLSLSELFVRFGIAEFDTPALRREFQGLIECALADVFPGLPVHWDVP